MASNKQVDQELSTRVSSYIKDLYFLNFERMNPNESPKPKEKPGMYFSMLLRLGQVN